MAKKAATKPVAKRKPAKKAPVTKPPTTKSIVGSSSPWRRLLWSGGVVAGLVVAFVGGAWSAGGWQVGPGPKNDSVSAVFDTQESAFRKRNGELAVKLKAGEFESEDAAKNWMTENYIPESEAAWIVLLKEEAEAFGGEKWTAEKHAAHIERYAR